MEARIRSSSTAKVKRRIRQAENLKNPDNLTDKQQQIASVFVLDAIGKGLTRVTFTSFTKPSAIKKAFFNLLLKKKLKSNLDQSIIKLNNYCKELYAKQVKHKNSVVLDPKFLAEIPAAS